MKKKLSIIIPIYNTEKYLIRCLDSVCRQEYDNLEIVLIDDGSTDSCGEICDRYAENDQRVIVIHKDNRGLVSARKEGLSRCSGDYVTYVDSDDWIEENAYEQIMDILENKSVDFLTCPFIKDYVNFSSTRNDYPDEGYYDRQEIENIIWESQTTIPFYCQVISASLCTKIVKKEYLIKYQFSVPDEIELCEDMAVTLPMLCNANSIYVYKKAYYHYVQNRESMCWQQKRGAFDKFKLLYNHLNKITIESRTEIERYILNATLFSMMEVLYDIPKDYFHRGLPFFSGLCLGSRIVVYGKGVFAQNVLFVTQKNNLYTVVANIDSEDVDQLVNLDDNKYDYVVVAVLDGFAVKKIKDVLATKIDKNKIITINEEKLDKSILPSEVVKLQNKNQKSMVSELY